jgi:hypothetical protein
LSEEDDTYSTMFTALKHPIRRKILRIINQSPVTYTEILSQLEVDNGLLNYHLDNMKDLIAKRDGGQYVLSEFGKAAVALTQKVEETTPKADTYQKRSFWPLVSIVLILVVSAASLSFLYSNQNTELNQKKLALNVANNKLEKLSVLGELSNITTSAILTGGVQIVNKYAITFYYLNQSVSGEGKTYGTGPVLLVYVPVEGSVVDLNVFVNPIDLYELDLTLQRGNALKNETLVEYDITYPDGSHAWASPIVWELKTAKNGVYETPSLGKGWYTFSIFGPVVHANNTKLLQRYPSFEPASPFFSGPRITFLDVFVKLEVKKDGVLTFFNVSTELA